MMPETLAALLARGVLGEEAGDVGVFHGTRVDDHAIAVAQALAGFDGRRAVLRFVIGEHRQAPRVGGEEAVGAGVPAYRVARILRMIENGDTYFLPADLAGIIA